MHSVPLRLGFVFVTSFNMSLTGSVDVSVAINNAYHYFMESKNSKEAIKFLSSVSNL